MRRLLIIVAFITALVSSSCKMPSRSTIEAVTQAGCLLVDTIAEHANPPDDRCRLSPEEVRLLKKELEKRK